MTHTWELNSSTASKNQVINDWQKVVSCWSNSSHYVYTELNSAAKILLIIQETLQEKTAKIKFYYNLFTRFILSPFLWAGYVNFISMDPVVGLGRSLWTRKSGSLSFIWTHWSRLTIKHIYIVTQFHWTYWRVHWHLFYTQDKWIK